MAGIPVQPYSMFPPRIHKRQNTNITQEHRGHFPSVVIERKMATIPPELRANFPAVVFEEDVLSVNVVEGAVCGTHSHHRSANQGGEGEGGNAPEHLLEGFDLSGESFILLF